MNHIRYGDMRINEIVEYSVHCAGLMLIDFNMWNSFCYKGGIDWYIYVIYRDSSIKYYGYINITDDDANNNIHMSLVCPIWQLKKDFLNYYNNLWG